MIRVTANSFGKGTPVKYGYGIEKPEIELAQNMNITGINATSNPLINNVSIVAPESPVIHKEKSNRTFQYYSIERLIHRQEPSAWTLLETNHTDTTYIDSGYSTLDWGRYQYAIRAWYTGDIPSLPRLSNILDHNMYVPFTVNITTSGGASAEGAKVVLTCLDGIAEHVFTEYADENGVAYFPEVWRDSYKIWVSLNGHLPHHDTDIDITEENEIDVELEEKVLPPMNVFAVANDSETVATITWEPGQGEIKSYIYDEGTMHGGGCFNPGYNYWLGNMFDVQETGQILSVDMYWMHHDNRDPYRTVTVDIMDGNKKIVYKSNQFIPVDDDWMNITINNVPYSGTFYVMVHWEPTQGGITNYLGFDYLGAYAEEFKSYIFDGNTWINAFQMFDGFPFVSSIRANVLWQGKAKTYTNKITENVISLDIQDNNDIVSSVILDIPIDAQSKYIPQNESTRIVEDYSIWRILEGDEDDESLWMHLASGLTEPVYEDTNWVTLPFGEVYLWAVKTKYTAGLSFAAFSNELVKGESSITRDEVSGFVIYPNPATSELRVESGELRIENIEIFDMTGIKQKAESGRQKAEGGKQNGELVVDISHLSAGVYMIRIFDGQKYVTQRFVKK